MTIGDGPATRVTDDESGLRVQLFGRVAAWRGTREVELGPPRRRALFVVLALNAGQPVSRDELITTLWADAPPTQAVNVIQTYVKHLRQALDPSRAARQHSTVLPRASDGYTLDIGPLQIDALRFRQLSGDVRLARRDGDRELVCRLAEEALKLAYAPVAVDVPLLSNHPKAATIADERAMVAEWFAEAALHRGVAGDALTAVEEAAHARPLDESIHAWLIRIYYAIGRRSDALACYTRIRRRLAEELGMDPAPELSALHEAVLRDDPAPGSDQPAGTAAEGSAPSRVLGQRAPARPRCLPRDLADFTGREQVLADLLRAVPAEGRAAAPVILVIDGMPGVGKTTLATRLAHRVAARYPDAHLYLDLLGHSTGAPLDTATALDTLLRQLGVPGESIPERLDERVNLWRNELAGRRTLLLLDNVSGGEQIAPVLPAEPGCLTLITSRRRLAGLDGAVTLSLDVLATDEAVALQQRIVGARVLAAPEAARDVAHRCGHLPLAIRLAAARLAHRPGWSVPDLVERLRAAQAPLRELALQGRTVEAAFALSYQQISPPAQRLFRLLAGHPGADLGVPAAAALADLDLDEAEELLAELVDGHLVEERATGRYWLHDLLREYAGHLSDTTDSAAERRAATGRLLEVYLHTGGAAAAYLEPMEALRFDYQLGAPPRQAARPLDSAAARAWFDAERANLVATVRLAAEGGWHRYTWRLTRAAWRDLYVHGYDDLCQETHRLAIDAARRAGEPFGLAISHNDLAATHYIRARWDEALHHIEVAIDIRRELGDWEMQTFSLVNKGIVLGRCGRYPEALKAYREALALRLAHPEGTDDLLFAAYISIASVSVSMGDLATAEECLQLDLDLADRQDSSYQRAIGRAHLGDLRSRQGRFAEAVELLESALADEQFLLADPQVRADAVRWLGSAYRGAGRLSEALDCHRRGLTMIETDGSLVAECAARIELAATLRALGDPGRALDQYRRALDTARRLGLPPQVAQASEGIAALAGDAGEPATAARPPAPTARAPRSAGAGG